MVLVSVIMVPKKLLLLTGVATHLSTSCSESQVQVTQEQLLALIDSYTWHPSDAVLQAARMRLVSEIVKAANKLSDNGHVVADPEAYKVDAGALGGWNHTLGDMVWRFRV